MHQITKKEKKERARQKGSFFFHSNVNRFTIRCVINAINYGTWVVSNCKYVEDIRDIRLIKKEFIFYALAKLIFLCIAINKCGCFLNL